MLPAGEVVAEGEEDRPRWRRARPGDPVVTVSVNKEVKERVNMLLEASMALEQVTFETADHKEATMSFKEKRKPKFGQE